MKHLIWILFIASISSMLCGYFLEVSYAEKLIGFGVFGLFLVVFPLFTYYRWKDRNVKDYLLTKENLDKMQNHEK